MIHSKLLPVVIVASLFILGTIVAEYYFALRRKTLPFAHPWRAAQSILFVMMLFMPILPGPVDARLTIGAVLGMAALIMLMVNMSKYGSSMSENAVPRKVQAGLVVTGIICILATYLWQVVH